MRDSFTHFVFVAIFPIISVAQAELIPAPANELKGSPKSSLLERTYILFKGQRVNEVTYKISYEEYDEAGRLVQSSNFGDKVEQRTTYMRKGDVLNIEIHYYDEHGNKNDNLAVKFSPNANVSSDEGLCPNFIEIHEDDRVAKIERVRELCTDRSQRAETTYEYGVANELFHVFRRDAKLRTWDTTLNYDSNGNQTEQRLTVNDGKRPSFVQTVHYSDYRFDEKGNWTRITAVAYDSLHGEQIRFQFLEKQTVEYWPNQLKR